MKNPVKPVILPFFTIAAGIVGMVLRMWMFSSAIDEKGLLITSHPANYLLYALLILTVLGVLVFSLKCSKTVTKAFPASVFGSFGAFVAAAGILAADFTELNTGDIFSVLSFVMGLLAAAGFAEIGIRRLKGNPGSLISHTLICAYFMIHLVLQYRQWSAEPQLQNYFFPLLASILLMLCCYHRAVADLKGANHRWYVFTNQTALFCCFLSMNTETWVFYAAMILWCATDLHICPKQEEQ